MTWKELSEEYKLHVKALDIRIEQLKGQFNCQDVRTTIQVQERIKMLSIMRDEANELSRLTENMRNIGIGPDGPRGCIGPLGAYGGPCPRCGHRSLRWDHHTDITSCPECGWCNNTDAEENRRKRIENGEIRPED